MMFRLYKQARFLVVPIAVLALLLSVAGPVALHAQKKSKKDKEKEAPKQKTFLDVLDISKIVWPNPPAIARVRYLNFFSGEKFKGDQQKQQGKKESWMDRLAGVSVGKADTSKKPRFQLIMPYGVAVDSKNRLYIADRKVSAIFVVNTESWDFDMIKNGVNARFGAIIGLAIDDSDRVFVSDSVLHRVLVFGPDFKVEGNITEGLKDPGGLAIDNENRFLYVADAENDQIFVFDADPPYKLIRKMGTGGRQHTLTTPGDFAKPSNVAVDADGNLYVTDTLNDRVEIFDADGNFIRTWGKPGDGPGYFARPKGIAIDSDGHVWVADGVQNRLQAFTQEGRLLLYMGGDGLLPGQFSALAGVTIDKNNRIFTSEQYPGRVQMFRYVTDEEARAEKERRDAEQSKESAAKLAGKTAQASDEKSDKGAAKPDEKTPQ